jgi:hypothetical protein
MVDWNYLKNNITELNLNMTTTLNNPDNLTVTLINTADTSTQGYLGLGIMLIMFIVLTFTIFRQDKDIKMDIARSIMLSSGFVSIVGFIATLSNIFSSFTHVTWFFMVFLFSLLGVYVLKKKNL